MCTFFCVALGRNENKKVGSCLDNTVEISEGLIVCVCVCVGGGRRDHRVLSHGELFLGLPAPHPPSPRSKEDESLGLGCHSPVCVCVCHPTLRYALNLSDPQSR